MDNRNVLAPTVQRILPTPRSAVQDVILARSKPVDVVSVDSSWWETRVKQGVHVLNPSQANLEYAMELSRRLGTYTVYAYYDNLHFKKVNNATIKR